jgi:2,4-dienoyl-CoA reductase-like NADH-dependent reductase (Old Yellow Enzyme family)/NADPH-dependent 2,4-dienoyl-CoA reductase/sulfur reductase-like enzyme
MSRKYEHLLSPYKIGNVYFRNRMSSGPNDAHFLQGPETWVTDPMITWLSNIARNGAAWVTTIRDPVPHGYTMDNLRTIYGESKEPLKAKPSGGVWQHLPPSDMAKEHYISQMTEAIHFYGAKASIIEMRQAPEGYEVSANVPSWWVYGDGSYPIKDNKEAPIEVLEQQIDDIANRMWVMKRLGHDMCYLHMAYRVSVFGKMLSPLTNFRNDKYGGSLENRTRFIIEVADRIKQRCGKDFIIEGSISGEDAPGGYTLQDAVEYAKLLAGHIDILQLRGPLIDPSNLYAYIPESNPTPTLRYTEAIKKSGARIAVLAIGGFSNPDWGEAAIASGKADFIGMSRAWTSNPDFGSLVYEGRTEDIVPCIRCNKCHSDSYAEPWAPHCSVNPTYSMEWKIDRMIAPPAKKKKVAVVGGGLAGMKAAMVAAERGHDVTLYEKSGELGGLLRTASMASFKWPLRRFMEYMYRHVEKSRVKVLLNTEATPEMLTKGKYDAILAAVGSEPVVPDIPGVNDKNVKYAIDVYGNEDSIGKSVVVIGGGEVGVETALHLAEKGHKVKVVERLNMLASDAPPVHYYAILRDYWEKQPNFSYVVNAFCTGIKPDKVTYLDADGKEHDIKVDSVVIAVGMKAKNDLAMQFYGAGDRLYTIGDCDKAGNVQKVMRSAFSIASMI